MAFTLRKIDEVRQVAEMATGGRRGEDKREGFVVEWGNQFCATIAKREIVGTQLRHGRSSFQTRGS